jgi:hypothetical protein
MQAVYDFAAFARDYPDDENEADSQREHLLAALRTARQPALLAGVRLAGQSAQQMDEVLDKCLAECIGHRGRLREWNQQIPEESVEPGKTGDTYGPRWFAHIRLAGGLVQALRRLDDLAALAVLRERDSATPPESPPDAAGPPPESRTIAALAPRNFLL